MIVDLTEQEVHDAIYCIESKLEELKDYLKDLPEESEDRSLVSMQTSLEGMHKKLKQSVGEV